MKSNSDAYRFVDIQSQFKDLFEQPYAEFALYSGRGAGKSRAVAQYLIFKASKEKLKILCIREIKDSVSDSVMEDLKKAVGDFGFEPYFIFKQDSVLCKATGTEIIYRGAFKHVDAIKSLSGINLCWVEEAHTISEEALRVLLPTIFRNEGAKIIYTYNPKTMNDAVYKRFHGKYIPEDAIVLQVDWRNNQFFSKRMVKERALDFKKDPDMAMHVWEGALCPSPNSCAVLPMHYLRECVDAHIKLNLKIPTSKCFRYMGLDLADGGEDVSALALRHGSILLDVKELEKGLVSHAVDKAHAYALAHGPIARIHFDSAGVGAGAKTDFARITDRVYLAKPYNGAMSPEGKDYDFNDQSTNGQFFRNRKAQAWWNLHLRLHNTMRLLDGEKVNIHRCLFIASKIPEQIRDKLIMELGQASYKHEDGKLMVDKQPDDQPSPNMADATVMAFARDLDYGISAKS